MADARNFAQWDGGLLRRRFAEAVNTVERLETDLAAARRELEELRGRRCETCKHKFVWTVHDNAPGCYHHCLPLPPDCLGCAAYERRAQTADADKAGEGE